LFARLIIAKSARGKFEEDSDFGTAVLGLIWYPKKRDGLP